MIVRVQQPTDDLTWAIVIAISIVIVCSLLVAAYPPEDEGSLREGLRRFLRRPLGRVEFSLIVTGLMIAAQVMLHALLGGGL